MFAARRHPPHRGIVSPYSDDDRSEALDCLAREGYECVADAHCRPVATTCRIASVPPDADRRDGARGGAARPQAIVCLCTNFPAAVMAAPLEAELGIPVYDSTALGVWHALRLAGVPIPARPRAVGMALRAGVMTMEGTLVIAQCRVLTLDDAQHEWPCADIVIDGTRIAAIGPTPRRPGRPGRATHRRRAAMLAMPGLINAHFHSPGNLMKGSLDGMPLELFMLLRSAAAGRRRRRAAAWSMCARMLGAMEMLRRGITSVHDDAYHVPVATRRGSRRDHAGLCRHAGMRATVAIDQPNIVEYENIRFSPSSCRAEQRAAMDARAAPDRRRAAGAVRAPVERWHGAADGGCARRCRARRRSG